jgi:hypothetical protein
MSMSPERIYGDYIRHRTVNPITHAMACELCVYGRGEHREDCPVGDANREFAEMFTRNLSKAKDLYEEVTHVEGKLIPTPSRLDRLFGPPMPPMSPFEKAVAEELRNAEEMVQEAVGIPKIKFGKGGGK